MSYIKPLFFGIFLLCTASLITGCSDYVGKEKTHPLFVKGGASRSAGNYKEAAQYYEDFLYVCPKSPLAHLELAAVYGDHLDNPFRAMYHYEKYLELSPNSPDAPDVKKFADACRKRIFDRLSKDYVSTDATKAQAESESYKAKLQEYVEYSRKLQEQNEKMKQMIRNGQVTREVSVRPLRIPENQQPQTNHNTAQEEQKVQPQSRPQPQNTASTGTGERTYTVGQGDSLIKISIKMYGSQKYWRMIRDANPGKIGAQGQVRAGVTIRIPDIGGRR